MAPQGDDAKVASPETSPHLKPRSCDIVLNPEVSLKIYQLVDLPLMANPRDGAGGGRGRRTLTRVQNLGKAMQGPEIEGSRKTMNWMKKLVQGPLQYFGCPLRPYSKECFQLTFASPFYNIRQNGPFYAKNV